MILKQGQAAWFEGGKLNVAVNCIDRHLVDGPIKLRLSGRGTIPRMMPILAMPNSMSRSLRLGNVLRQRGVKKGDRVCIYMPMIPEAAYAMLACARIGAVHSVVFGGFSPEALKDRILDSDCQVVITADEGCVQARRFPLKPTPIKPCKLPRCSYLPSCAPHRRHYRLAA